jgi:replicative DNA helicase
MMSNEEVTLAQFGRVFQEKLLQLMLDDVVFCDQMQEVLKIGYFELKYLQEFAHILFSYRDSYKKHPSHETIKSILRTEAKGENEALEKQVMDYFARISSDSVGSINEEFVRERAVEFCKKQTLKEAMLKSVKLLETASFDQIQKLINDSLKLGTNNENGHDFIKHFEERYKFRARNPTSTGWKTMDEMTEGGLGKGELTVVIASTGSGKSMCLVHLGAEALKQGKNVIYYTLELRDTVVGLRFDACLTKKPLSSLKSLKDEVYEDIVNVPGKLVIKEYPTKSASVATIRAHIEKLRQRDFVPDMIIVDYGDLLRPSAPEREKRNELESIYEELRGLGGQYECTVVTASQTNRSGLNAEIITMESISEAFNKCFVADFIFSISRTVQDKQNNGGRVFIAKNRNGPDGIVCPIYMDTSTVTIDVKDPTNETVQEIKNNLLKEQELRLKEKYKQLKSNN